MVEWLAEGKKWENLRPMSDDQRLEWRRALRQDRDLTDAVVLVHGAGMQPDSVLLRLVGGHYPESVMELSCALVIKVSQYINRWMGPGSRWQVRGGADHGPAVCMMPRWRTRASPRPVVVEALAAAAEEEAGAWEEATAAAASAAPDRPAMEARQEEEEDEAQRAPRATARVGGASAGSQGGCSGAGAGQTAGRTLSPHQSAADIILRPALTVRHALPLCSSIGSLGGAGHEHQQHQRGLTGQPPPLHLHLPHHPLKPRVSRAATGQQPVGHGAAPTCAGHGAAPTCAGHGAAHPR